MKPALIVRNLEYSYSPGSTIRFPDFECLPGSNLLILGNSGTGKTTLLHLIALILPITHGEIEIDGQSVTELSPAALTRFRAQKTGLVFQQNHFVQSLSVIDNLLIANYFGRNKIQPDKALELAESLGISHLLKKPVYELSGGEMQRVNIARALMNDPSVILADEPTASLDDENCDRVFRLLKESAERIGATLIIVTHDGRLKSKTNHQIILT